MINITRLFPRESQHIRCCRVRPKTCYGLLNEIPPTHIEDVLLLRDGISISTDDEYNVGQVLCVAFHRIGSLIEVVGRTDGADDSVHLIRRTAKPGGAGVANRLLFASGLVAANLNAEIKLTCKSLGMSNN